MRSRELRRTRARQYMERSSGLPRRWRNNPIAMVFGSVIAIAFGLTVMAVLTFTQLGLCHLIAKWFFDATEGLWR